MENLSQFFTPLSAQRTPPYHLLLSLPSYIFSSLTSPPSPQPPPLPKAMMKTPLLRERWRRSRMGWNEGQNRLRGSLDSEQGKGVRTMLLTWSELLACTRGNLSVCVCVSDLT